jgi:hypothetical protein
MYRRRGNGYQNPLDGSVSRSFASVSQSSRQPKLRRQDLFFSLQPTEVVRRHRGDVADENDCESNRAQEPDVPPCPLGLSLGQRKYARSPLTDASWASTADL